MVNRLDPGQIRVLYIQPGNAEHIVCDTEITTLALSIHKYDALSYAWGGQDLTHTITVSNKPYAVTSNLYGALKHLRPKDGKKRAVWIDAICINQQDHDEQTQQVNMMAHIYRNARLVVMWLGEEVKMDNISIDGVAFSLLEQLRRVFEDNGHVEFDFQRKGPEGIACPGYGLPNSNAREWIALARLFSKPYFERIWIIQEVVMATRAIIACGDLRAEWEVVRNVARSLQRCGSLGSLEYVGAAPGVISVNAMADLKHGKGVDLITLLVKTRTYQATKEVDKAFALMNLSSNPHNAGIVVDYSLEGKPQKVWEKLALHSLTVHQSLLCLSNAGIRSSPQQSWIPNWSDNDDGRTCLALHGKDHFRASGDLQAIISVSENSKVLTVEGYIVDSVAIVAPSIPNFVPKAMRTGPLEIWLTIEELEERKSLMVAALQSSLETAKSAFRYNEGFPRDRELARTLCCDILMTGEKANIDAGYEILQWMIKVAKLFGLEPLPKDLEKVDDIQRQVETIMPSGVDTEGFLHSWLSFGTGRNVCATVKGDLGRVAFGARPGDSICILKGGKVPYLLRKDGSGYKLVGECFVNGIMYSEALKCKNLVEQTFKIN